MQIDNKIDNLLSGPRTFVGYVFILTGIFIIVLNDFEAFAIIIGSIIILFSVFLLTTSTGVEIDSINRRIKQYNNIFGLYKTGQWQSLNAFLGLTLIPIRKVSTIASRANLTTSTIQHDYRIYLVNKARKPAFAIKKCATREQAQNSIDEFSIWLKMPVYSIKR